MAVRSGVIVLSDEIHSGLVLGDRRHTAFGSISPEFERGSITFLGDLIREGALPFKPEEHRAR